MTYDLPDFRNPQDAFESAISKGIFTEKEPDKLYIHTTSPSWKNYRDKFVGNWMYMHSQTTASGKLTDSFKHRDTRKYLTVEVR